MRIVATIVLLFALGLYQNALAVDWVSGNARVIWQSTSTETRETETTTKRLNQAYILGFTKDITPAILFSADVNVNSNEIDSETADDKSTVLSPTFRLDFNNDYFDANAGYELNETGVDVFWMDSDDDRVTGKSWNLNFSTKSEKYPRIRFIYDEDIRSDHLQVRETDTRSRFYDIEADYSYKMFDFTVSHSENVGDDFVADSTSTDITNEASVSFDTGFWNNRIIVDGSYRFSDTENELVAREKDVEFKIRRTASGGRYVQTLTPAGTPPLLWNSDMRLVDGNVDSPLPINLKNLYQNIRIDLIQKESVELIYLWVKDQNPFPPTPIDDTQYNWQLYSSSDGTTWTPVAGLTVTFDKDENRFEFSFASTSAQYFRVVNLKNDARDIDVTEIEAFGFNRISAQTSQVNTTTLQQIRFHTGAKPLDWVKLDYSMTQDENEYDPDSRKTRRSDHNISVRADRQLAEDVSGWVQYEKKLEYDTESEDKSTDRYLLHLAYDPFEALSSSFSLSHSLYKTGSVEQSRDTASLLHMVAQLREGVELNLDGSVSYSENMINNTETLAKTLNSDLRLQLTRKLTAEITYNSNWSDTESADGSESSSYASNIRTDAYYRPSRVLYLRGGYELRTERGRGDTTRNELSVNWIPTGKIRLNFNCNQERNPSQRLTSYSSDLLWDLSKVFVFRVNYDWSRIQADDDTETQSITTSLTASF